MSKLFSNLHPFFTPDDVPGGGTGSTTIVPSGGLSHEDEITFMGEDDDNKDVIELEEGKGKGKEKDKEKGKEKDKEDTQEDDETPETTEEEDEETDELDELEAELEEPTEEQLELMTPVRRREILKKYPQLFKDFPYLERAYYREQQYTELLPTIEDAKAAVEKAGTLDRFENDLMGGNIETVLKAVKETNPNGFYKIVDNYLTTLSGVDEKAYFHVLGNITKHTIATMVQEARRLGVSQTENAPGNVLQNAALALNQFVFGTSDYKPPTNLANQGKPEENTKEKELQEKEQKFVRSQFDNTRNDLNTRVTNTLRNTIDVNIDPKQSMTDYVRRNASRDAFDQLETLMNKDARFRTLVDKLWEHAFKDGFSQESKDRIRSAYVSKARTLLPSVIKKARNEALRGMGKRVKEDEDTTPEKRGPVTPGRPRSQSTTSGNDKGKKNEVPKGMSTLDFLNSD